MRVKLLNDTAERMFAVIFQTGDDPVAGLTAFALGHKLKAASFTAIGAFSEAILGYFEWEKKEYERIAVAEQVEVLSLLGDITLQDGKPHLHAHVRGHRRGGAGLLAPPPRSRQRSGAHRHLITKKEPQWPAS